MSGLNERYRAGRLNGMDEKSWKWREIAEGNRRALKAGYNFGETTEIFHERYIVPPAKLPPGTYRNITGNEATALGFVAASQLAGRTLFYGSDPITPAPDILPQPAGYKNFRLPTFPARGRVAASRAASRA